MKIIIAGSRSFNNYNLLSEKMSHFTQNKINVTVISGKAKGADTLGERWAIENNYDIIDKPAQWDLYGKSAGYKRNEEMADIADGLVAFWDGVSKGTKHMINIAKRKGLKIRIVYV